MTQTNPTTDARHAHRARIALEIVDHVDQAVRAGQPADQVLRQVFKEHRNFGSKDRRFYSGTVFSWFRWLGWTSLARKAPPELQVAMSSLLDADETTPELRYLAAEGGIPADTVQALASCSLDEKAQRITSWLGLDNAAEIGQLIPHWTADALFVPEGCDAGEHVRQCIRSFQSRPPTWLRVPKSAKSRVLAYLQQKKIQVTPHERLPCALAVHHSFALNELQSKAQAHAEIQDLASQCVGYVCSPHPKERWWDACAGAGGKALHLAALMEKRGYVLATDPRAHSLTELHRRVRSARVGHIVARKADITLDAVDDQTFDGVLVDAPCSGLGTWSRNPDARWRMTAEKLRERADLQKQLLTSAARAVSPSGALVYAVCTLTREETTEVVGHFLNGHSDFQLEPFPHPLSRDKTDGMAWIWPWMGPCNGMFVARFRKV